jgi:hypothetical protein
MADTATPATQQEKLPLEPASGSDNADTGPHGSTRQLHGWKVRIHQSTLRSLHTSNKMVVGNCIRLHAVNNLPLLTRQHCRKLSILLMSLERSF